MRRKRMRLRSSADDQGSSAPRLMLVGPSKEFLSGIAYYTYGLAAGLADQFELSVLFIRRLVPRRLYPGAQRVGHALSTIALPDKVPAFDGLDYYWGRSIIRAVRFLRRHRPEVLVLQWWTGTVLHSYLLLAFVARRLGVRTVIEFHEGLDPGEQRYRLVSAYVGALAPRLFARCDSYVVHSEFDRQLLSRRYDLEQDRMVVIPHALYDHSTQGGYRREAPEGVCNLLFFGLIRPVKGLDLLLDALESLPKEQSEQFWLTIVGETWENCEPIVERARSGPFASRITVVNRYVSDEEADAYFGGADAVVLPYRASSQSGVLHMAMNYGLPVLVTEVGGLVEAIAGYDAAVTVTPESAPALVDGLGRLRGTGRTEVAGGHRWSDSAVAYRSLVSELSPVGAERGAA